jgi:hypothetical protein
LLCATSDEDGRLVWGPLQIFPLRFALSKNRSREEHPPEISPLRCAPSKNKLQHPLNDSSAPFLMANL